MIQIYGVGMHVLNERIKTMPKYLIILTIKNSILPYNYSSCLKYVHSAQYVEDKAWMPYFAET